MPLNQKIKTTRPAIVETYLSRVPHELRDILIPSDDQLTAFGAAVKALRMKEEERYYVMDIQRRYGLPIRPNDSVKKTMIRVRLAILKERRDPKESERSLQLVEKLPVDPLE
jgi:hypothetical protein